MSLPLPSFLSGYQEPDWPPEKIAIIVPLVFLVKSGTCFSFELTKLASARCNCVLRCFLPKYWQGFASHPLHIDERQQEIILVGGAEHVEPFRADHAGLLELIVQPVEPLLEVQELQVHFDDSVTAKNSILFDVVSVEDCEHFARVATLLVRA